MWVSLAALFPCDEPRPYADGWDTQAQVPGELHIWSRSTTGQWIAPVHYRMARGGGSEGMRLTYWGAGARGVTEAGRASTKDPSCWWQSAV
ncbi:hypothetical protein GCM10010470_02570 [Saccharopolyspora taberi]|uniref:Uncharacterized protein n=1 Tax=Saccharopolyspora taberi TaxID=60895 RepID=A0ABN3V0W4_9PSEU